MWTHTRSSGRRGAKGGRTGGATGDAVIDAAGVDAHAATDMGLRADASDVSWFSGDHAAVDVDTAPPTRGDDRVAEVHELYGERETRDGHHGHPSPAPPAGHNGIGHSGAEHPDAGDGGAHHNGASAPPQVRNTTGLDTEALRETLAMIGDRIDELGVDFYAQLFALAPETRELFGASMEVQRSRLLGALVRIVGSADDREEFVPYLEALGRDHRKFGVIDQHYAPVGTALILALRKMLGEKWLPRHEQAWIQAYDAIAMTMSGAARRDAVISPPWWDAEVVYHRRVLDDLAVIQVRPHTEYPYRPGQYAFVTSPRRPKIWRAYSMASAPRDDGLLEFHVRSVGAGWISSALVWRTEPGDVLHLGAPQGADIASPRSERDLLCITGGTGIAPILATLQELEQRQDGRRVHVFYAGRDRDHLYALPHLESIGVRYRRLTVVPVVSPDGTTDRSPDLMGNIVSAYGDWRKHRVYVAGPSSMVSTSLERLREQGVPDSQIVHDDYGLW